MSARDWGTGWARSLGLRLSGRPAAPEEEGAPADPESDLLLLFTAHDQPVEFRLPRSERGRVWHLAADTARPEAEGAPWSEAAPYLLEGRSLALFASDGALKADRAAPAGPPAPERSDERP